MGIGNKRRSYGFKHVHIITCYWIFISDYDEIMILIKKIPCFAQETGGPLSPWINNHMPSEVLGETTYPFPNSNGWTVEVW